jgi:hypothetical protein
MKLRLLAVFVIPGFFTCKGRFQCTYILIIQLRREEICLDIASSVCLELCRLLTSDLHWSAFLLLARNVCMAWKLRAGRNFYLG